MSFCISTEQIRAVCLPNAKTCGSVWRWTHGLPRHRVRYSRGGSGASYFRLVDLVPALRKTRKGLTGERLRALVDLNDIQPPSVPLDGNHIALTRCLTRDERERLHLIQKRFGAATVSAFFDRYLFVDADDMKARLILNGAVLAHVLTKTREHLPYTDSGWTAFAADFVIANSAPETLRRLNQPYQQTIRELENV